MVAAAPPPPPPPPPPPVIAPPDAPAPPRGRLYEVTPDGTLNFYFHPGQAAAWQSRARFTWMLAGTQGGKTSFSPLWLWREMRQRGPGDYLAVTSTYPLLKLKMLPEYMRFFRLLLGLGEWHAMDRVFVVDGERAALHFGDGAWRDEPSRIIFGSGINPEGLESATAKGAALDECVPPETLIETEMGPIPIGTIVNHQLDVRVWSYDTERGEWQLRPIGRWMRRPQTSHLARVGPLRLTGNHRVWTQHGYVPAGDVVIHPAWYTVLHARPVTNEYAADVLALRRAADGQGPEDVLFAGLRTDALAGAQSGTAAHGIAGRAAGHLGSAEAALRESGEPTVGPIWRREDRPPDRGAGTTGGACPSGPTVGERREWSSALLASRIAGACVGLAERVRGDDREGLVAASVQDRRGGTGPQGGDRSGQRGVTPQEGVVRSEWVDVPALFQPDGGDVAGWRSGDGHVYNLTVEGNHNYVANGILVANCGQDDFRLQSYEAILRRLALNQGRILGGTTIYNMGWIKQQAYDPWRNGDPDHNVIQFASTINPAFPQDEFDRARRTMQSWKFDMFYRGQLSRPGGLIYDDYSDEYREDGGQGGQKVRPFAIPAHWPCYVGVDFGAVNMALVWLAKDPATRVYYLYREVHGGVMSSKEHARRAKRLSQGERVWGWWGGAKSEKQQRMDWAAAGVKLQEPPVADVEVGIDRVTALLREGRLFVFDTCPGVREEFGTYSRVLDEAGEPTDKIKDKERFHLLDALRYAAAGVTKPGLRSALAQAIAPHGWGL